MMKRLIVRILLFFIPIIIFAYVADHLLTQSLKRSRAAELAGWNDLLNGELNADVLVYGSSRAWRQVDPKILEDSAIGKSVYNLGMDGHNFYMQLLRHKLVLQNNIKPACILLTLDYTTLNKRSDLFNQGQFIPYFDDTAVVNATKAYEGFDFFDYHLPLVRFGGDRWLINEGIKCAFRKNDLTTNRYKGFLGSDLPWNNDFDKLRQTHPNGFEQKLDTPSIRLFENFLADTKKRGIKMVLIYSPEYIEGQKFVTNRKNIFLMYDSFAEKYEIPFLDYSPDSISYNRKYFYNTSHLNIHGAEIFSKKLAADLKKLSL